MSELSAFQTEARDMELAPTKRLPRVASFPHFLSTQEMGPPEAEHAKIKHFIHVENVTVCKQATACTGRRGRRPLHT